MLLAAIGLATTSATARADAFECKRTETQAECHDRLKCKANEELEDCQKRLRVSTSAQPNSNGANADHRDTRDDRDSGRGADRGDNDRGNRGQADRSERDSDENWDRRGGRRSRRGQSSFVANKQFGLGLELGEPDGLNGKYFVAPSGALDFGIGYIYDHYYYGDGLHLYVDYLWHFSLASTASFELPFYIGPGLRFWRFDYCVQNLCTYNGSAVGIRMPLGIAFDFNNAPIDIFLEVVPTLDFLGGDYYTRYGDRLHFGADGSVGIRFWFK